MSSQYTIKIIQQLKQYESKQLNMRDLLFILNHLILNKSYSLQYIDKYIKSNYKPNQLDWKYINDKQIQTILLKQIQFISKHQHQWKQQNQQLFKINTQYIQEKKKIKKILKQKNINKQQLIDTYLEEIRRNKSIINKPKNYKTQKQSSDKKQSIQSNQKQKYEQNIQLLQKRINIMRDSSKFDTENLDHDQLLSQQNSIQSHLNQKELHKIIQEFEFKKNYFENLQKNSQREQSFRLKKKLHSKRKSFNRRLKQIFLHYSSQNYDPTLSFEKNNKKLIHIDLRLFLKYFKELKYSNNNQIFINDQKNQKKFKSNNLTLLFKKYGKNKKQINFHIFLNINYQLFLDKESAFQDLTQSEILGYQKEEISTTISRIDVHENFQQEIDKLENIQGIFFNQNVNKIINIHQKSQPLETQSRQKSRSFQQTSSSDNTMNERKPRQQRLDKFIDKSIEDYETTKNRIHDTFSKRHRIQMLRSLEERLISVDNNIKIIVNKKGKNGFIKSLQNQKNISIKKFNQYKQKSQQQNPNLSKKQKIEKGFDFASNKQTFEQIIKEVQQDQQSQQNSSFKGYKKSKSLGNILISNQKNHSQQNNHRLLKLKTRSTSQLKNIFTLPKITRISQQRLQHQSIFKTLDYLYNAMGKQQEHKIKKLLQLDNPELKQVNAVQNTYLKEYFNKETIISNEKHKIEEQEKKDRINAIHKNCKKFKEDNYEKFMKFS